MVAVVSFVCILLLVATFSLFQQLCHLSVLL